MTTIDNLLHYHNDNKAQVETPPHRPGTTDSYFQASPYRTSTPDENTSSSSGPLTPLSPIEKDCNHLERVKSEEKKIEWDIHSTSCQGPHHTLARRISKDGIAHHSPLSPEITGSAAGSGKHTPVGQAGEKGTCQNCEGCEKKEGKQW